MSKDIDPGPASIGIAIGVRAISFLCYAAASAFLLMPRFLLNLPESKENPEFTIVIPPTILKASILMPKKLNKYCHTNKDTIRIINTLIAVYNEIRDRSCLVSVWVSPTKIGTVPIGFNTENNPANR
jgi:hypothetical protein